MVPLVVVVLEKGIFSATAAAGLVIVCYQWVCVCRSALSLRNRKWRSSPFPRSLAKSFISFPFPWEDDDFAAAADAPI